MRRRCLFFTHTSWDHVRCEGLHQLLRNSRFLASLIAAQEKACPVDLPVGLIDNKAG